MILSSSCLELARNEMEQVPNNNNIDNIVVFLVFCSLFFQ